MKVIFALDHTDAAGRNYKAGAQHSLPDPQARNLVHRGLARELDAPAPARRAQPPARVPEATVKRNRTPAPASGGGSASAETKEK